MKELLSIFVIIFLIVLLITNPYLLADLFVALFKALLPIVQGIQVFVVEVFNQLL